MANSKSYGKPFLQMIIEPENKFRFRYKSESQNSSHGGILGRRSDTDIRETKKGSKKIYPTVKLMNYGGKKPVSIRVSLYTKDRLEKHVLELKGVTNGLYLQDLGGNHTAVFKNLAIINKKQDEVFSILLERKIKRQGISGAAAQQLIQAQSRGEFKEWMNENLDTVVLGFEAVYRDNQNVSICPEIYSDHIKNQKSSLRITRMSHVSGSCAGGQEVILLCDKVKKDAIKVIFTDGNDDDSNTWKAEGDFKKVDVHHQVAITFKTPCYDKNMERTVSVYLQQECERSESREFTYIPDSGQVKKRKIKDDNEAQVPSYQPELHFMNAISPSSSNYSASTDNGMYEPLATPNEDVCEPKYFASDLKSITDFLQQIPEVPLGNSSNSSQEAVDLEIPFDLATFDLSAEDIQVSDELSQCPFENNYPTFDVMQIEGSHPLPPNIDVPDSSKMNEEKLFCHSAIIFPKEHLHDDLRKLSLSSHSSNKSHENHPEIQLLQKHLKADKRQVEMKPFVELENFTSCLVKETYKDRNFSQDTPQWQMGDSSIVYNSLKNSNKEKKTISKNELKSNFNSKLKEKVSHILSEKDKFGNTLLHLAMLQNKNVSNVLKMNKILLPSDSGIVNAQNFKMQTPILLATGKNNWQLARLLLQNGADPSIKNADGNNCYHIASQNNLVHCLRELFRYPNLSGVDAFNFEGLSPLHIAVIKNSVECFYLLIEKSDINAPDKKSGRTSLHHAVRCSLFVGDLLKKVYIDVNCQDFSGNSPLHVACSLGNLEIVKQLLEAGADPLLRNFKQSLNITEEEGTEDETIDGQTPLDVAANMQVVELLKKHTQIQIEEAYLSDSDQSDHYTDASEVAMEKRLSALLDGCLKRTDWEKVVQYIDLDNYLDTILKCSLSPTMAILSFLKKNEENYIELFQNAVEIAGVADADVLKKIKEI